MASFYVEKHCEEDSCASWIIRWGAAADDDGVPALALLWEGGDVMKIRFPSPDDAYEFAAHLNNVFVNDREKC